MYTAVLVYCCMLRYVRVWYVFGTNNDQHELPTAAAVMEELSKSCGRAALTEITRISLPARLHHRSSCKYEMHYIFLSHHLEPFEQLRPMWNLAVRIQALREAAIRFHTVRLKPPVGSRTASDEQGSWAFPHDVLARLHVRHTNHRGWVCRRLPRVRRA